MTTTSAATRARQLLQLRRWDDAAAVAADGLATDPDDVELLRLLALAECELGRSDDAVATARRAAALRPDEIETFRTLGVALGRVGDGAGAIEQFRRGLALDPHDADLHLRIGEALLKQARRRTRRPRRDVVDEAEVHARQVLAAIPGRAEGDLLMSKVALARSDSGRASEHANAALAKDPNSAIARQLLGIAAEMDGDVSGAATHYVAAGKLDARSGTSARLLRRLRTASPLGLIATFLLFRLLVGIGGAVAGVVGAAVLVIAGFALIYFLRRHRAQQRLPTEARQILDRERRLRAGRFRR